MGKTVSVILATTGTAVVASLLTTLSVSQPVTAPSFTVRMVEKKYRFPEGSLGRTQEWVDAVRRDGSYAESRELLAPTGRAVTQRTIHDMNARKRTVVDGLTASLTTYPLSDKYIAYLKDRLSSCRTAKAEERSEFLGFVTIKVTTELVGSNDLQRKLESWLAPDLGCFPLRELSYMGRPGEPLQLVNAREATSIIRGEPSQEFYAIPANYLERTPSAVISEFARRYPGKINCDNCSKMEGADRSYFDANARQ